MILKEECGKKQIMKIKEILLNGGADLGIEIDNSKAEQLIQYAELLKEWNEKINLTAICDDEGIAIKHFLDSATALCTGKVGKSIIDVGTGAGFPGLVLKILKPEADVTLMDSLNKRITFLNDVIEKTSIEKIETVHLRAEDGAKKTEYREKFDTAVSRAVARLPVLAEYCLPYVKVGGYFLALKGPVADEELKEAKRAISILGGEVESVFDAKIPYSDLNHKIIIIKKVRHTPIKYPRKSALISKIPIEQCYKISKNTAK